MAKTKSIFDNAVIKRGIQRMGGKKEENIIYSIEVDFNEKPLIITVRLGKDFMDATVSDKKTGEMLEYVMQQGSKAEYMRKHNMSAAEVNKMLSLKET